MVETTNNHKNGNCANRVLAGRCLSCKNWNKKEESEYSKDMGECLILSGKWIENGTEITGKTYPKEEYPDTEKTGMQSYPICVHDGLGFEYSTKSWFGCVHYNAR